MKKVFWLFLILVLISCRRVSEDIINNVEINLSNLIKESTVTVGGVDEGFDIPVTLAEKSIQAWLIPKEDKPKDLGYFVESIDKTKATSKGGKLILESPVKEGKYYLYTVDSQGKIEKNGDNVITVDRKPMVEVVKTQVDGVTEFPTWNIKAKEYKKNNQKPVKYKVVVKEAGKILLTDEAFKGTEFVYNPTTKNGLFEVEVEAYYKAFENIEKSDKLNPKKENVVWSTKNFGGKIQVGDSNLNKPTIDTPAPTTPALPGEIKLPEITGTSYEYTFKAVAETVDAEQLTSVKTELAKVATAQVGSSYKPPVGLKDGEYLFEVVAIRNGKKSEVTVVKYIVKSTPTATVNVLGVTAVGETLTANVVFVDEAEDLENKDLVTGTTYQWYRGNDKINKAIGSTYTLIKADKGYPISVKVIPVAKTGNPKVGVEVSSAPSAIIAIRQEAKPEVQADDVNNYLDKKDGNKYEGTDLEYLDKGDNKWKTYNPSKPPIEWTGDIVVEIRKTETEKTDPSDSVPVTFTKISQNKPEIDRDDITNVITSVKLGMVYYDGTKWKPLTDTRLFPGEQIVRVKYAETPTHKESEEVSVIFTRPKAPDARKDDINNILIDSKGDKVTTTGLQYRTYASEDAWQEYNPATAKFDGAVSVEIRVAERKNADGVLVETAGESATVYFTDNEKPTKPAVVTNPGDEDNDPTTVGPALPLKPETITWPVGGAPTGTTYEYTFRPVNVFDNQIQSTGVAGELAKVANPQKGTSYTPVSGLRDGEYVLEIVAIKDGVKSEATKVTYKVESAPTVDVAISNTIIKVGETLNASVTNYKDEAGDEQGPSTYQWYASGLPIEKAIGNTYTITEKEIGKIITVEVIPTALTGYKKVGAPLRSTPTTAVPKLEKSTPTIGINDTTNVVTGVQTGMKYFDGTIWKPLTDTTIFPGDKSVRVKYEETATHKESAEVTVKFNRPAAPDAKKDDINNILIDSKGNKVTTSGLQYRTYASEDAWQEYNPATAKFDGAVSVEIRVAERKNADGILVETAGESTTVYFTKDIVRLPLLKANDTDNYVVYDSTGKILDMDGLEYRTNTQIGSEYLPYNSTLRFTEDVTVEIRVKGTSKVEESASQFVKFTKPIVYDGDTLQKIVDSLLPGTDTIYRRSYGDIYFVQEEINKHLGLITSGKMKLYISLNKGTEYTIKNEASTLFVKEQLNSKYVIDAPEKQGQYHLIIVYQGESQIIRESKRTIIVTNTLTADGSILTKILGMDIMTGRPYTSIKKGKNVTINSIDGKESAPIKELWIVPTEHNLTRPASLVSDYMGTKLDNQFEYSFNEGTKYKKANVSANEPFTIQIPEVAGKYRAYSMDTAGNVSAASEEFTVTN